MNAKSLFALLVIIALVASSAHALKIQKTQNHNQKEIHMMKDMMVTGFRHRMAEKLHMKDDDAEKAAISAAFMMEFFAFSFSDPDIMSSITQNKPLTPESNASLAIFLKENDNFIKIMKDVFEGKDAPACFKKLNDDQKMRIIWAFIDQIDLANFFRGKYTVDKQANKNIQEEIKGYPDLGEPVAKCYADNTKIFNNIL